jgi:alpha-galactosidase
MSKLDEFTLNVLCNPEVIEVDQDPLGECGRVVKLRDEIFLLIKRMADGSHALGLCNGSEDSATITAKWSDLGLNGTQRVRDLWRQKDRGSFKTEFKSEVLPHGVVLLRLSSTAR